MGIAVSKVQSSCRRVVVLEHSIAYCGVNMGIVIGVLLYHEIMTEILLCKRSGSEMEDCCIRSVLA